MDIFYTGVLISTVRYNSGLLDAGHNFDVHFHCIENIVLVHSRQSWLVQLVATWKAEFHCRNSTRSEEVGSTACPVSKIL